MKTANNKSTLFDKVLKREIDRRAKSINKQLIDLSKISEVSGKLDLEGVFPSGKARENLTTLLENVDTTTNCIDKIKKATEYVKNKLAKTENYCVAVDWLEFYGSCFVNSITGNFNIDANLYYELNQNFYLCNFRSMNSYYTSIADVYEMDNEVNRKVATLVFNAQSCKYASVEEKATKEYIDNVSTSNIQFVNEVLYECNLSDLIKRVFVALKYTSLSITRLDIAFDNTENLKDIVFDIDNNTLPELLAKKGQKNTSRVQRNGEYVSAKIGTNFSDKIVVCYNKTKELLRSKKAYISSFWQNNEIDTNKDVWRTEFRFNSKALKKLDLGVNKIIENIDCSQFLYEIVKSLNENLLNLKIRYKKRVGGVVKTFTHDFDLLPIRNLEYNIQKRIIEKIESDTYKLKLSLHLAYKYLLFGVWSEQTAITVINTVFSENKELEEWFATKSYKWHEKYKKKALFYRNRHFLNDCTIAEKSEYLKVFVENLKKQQN